MYKNYAKFNPSWNEARSQNLLEPVTWGTDCLCFFPNSFPQPTLFQDKFSHLRDVLCSINSAGTVGVQGHRGNLISSITPWPMLSPGSWEQTSGSLRRQPQCGQSLINRDLLHTAIPRNNAVCVCCVCWPHTNLQHNKLLPRQSSRPPCAGLLLGFFVVLIEPGPCSCTLSYSPRPWDRSSYERMRSPVLGGRQSGVFLGTNALLMFSSWEPHVQWN